MREARDYCVPPSKMLGLPWDAWGETDVLLAMCRRIVDSSKCPCGCGQDVSVSTDPDTEGRWEPTVQECFARAAIAEFQEKNKDDMPAGALVGVHLLPEGVEAVDPLEFNPARAAAEHAAMRDRLGLDE